MGCIPWLNTAEIMQNLLHLIFRVWCDVGADHAVGWLSVRARSMAARPWVYVISIHEIPGLSRLACARNGELLMVGGSALVIGPCMLMRSSADACSCLNSLSDQPFMHLHMLHVSYVLTSACVHADAGPLDEDPRRVLLYACCSTRAVQAAGHSSR